MPPNISFGALFFLLHDVSVARRRGFSVFQFYLQLMWATKNIQHAQRGKKNTQLKSERTHKRRFLSNFDVYTYEYSELCWYGRIKPLQSDIAQNSWTTPYKFCWPRMLQNLLWRFILPFRLHRHILHSVTCFLAGRITKKRENDRLRSQWTHTSINFIGI